MTHYMTYAALQYLYYTIKSQTSTSTTTSPTTSSAVDNIYLNLLPLYFPIDEGYSNEREHRPLPDIITNRSAYTVRRVRTFDPDRMTLDGCRVAFLSDRRAVDGQPSTIVWDEAREQLEKYLNFVRAECLAEGERVLYGAVCIGRYLRFYQLGLGQRECVGFDGTEERWFELREDEGEVHRVLGELRVKTAYVGVA